MFLTPCRWQYTGRMYMGLDMYLSKKHYVKNWDHQEPKEKHSFLIKRGGKVADYIDTKKISYIEEEVAYWRKANQIHKWFIDNCAEGNGDQTEMYVSREQLQELLDTCKKVLGASELIDGKINNGQQMQGGKWVDIKVDGKYIKDPKMAEELLPTESGFFFGGTDYDEYYIQDITDTIKVLEEELAKPETNYPSYYYSASW